MDFDQPVDDERGATSGRGGEEDTSPVAALEDTVFRMQRDLEVLQSGKPVSEDAEGNKTRAPGATDGTYDDKGALV